MANPIIPSANVQISNEDLIISREWYIFLTNVLNAYIELKTNFDNYVASHP